MSDKILKILLPSFEQANGHNESSFLVQAKIEEMQIGEYSLYPFDRYNFIEETEGNFEDYCFFARRLEFYEKPYLNDDGLIVFVINDLLFDSALSDDYQVAFLHDSVERIINKFKEDVADIYAIANNDNFYIYKAAGFKIADKDEVYGIWMHYVSKS